ncbi:hypothetical protein Pcinc_036602 [Petrolisthes cinctipes]|uniref:Uncharacterized protein n=1 Tax=Petrolisthes cinctipes TaxID=88211 RepID=A0AAE1BU56_PETCI|nr:hypothetical protein Pcinc_036602 [Petrolisthes cinctipes]
MRSLGDGWMERGEWIRSPAEVRRNKTRGVEAKECVVWRVRMSGEEDKVKVYGGMGGSGRNVNKERWRRDGRTRSVRELRMMQKVWPTLTTAPRPHSLSIHSLAHPLIHYPTPLMLLHHYTLITPHHPNHIHYSLPTYPPSGLLSTS